MSKFWIITDTHFGHDNIIKYCNRPENFADIIVNNWNQMISENDTVIHLGDVAWNNESLKIIEKLHGKKMLVLGNHDHNSLYYYTNHGFDFVCNQLAMTMFGMDIIFTHKPLIFHEHDLNICGHLHGMINIEGGNPCYSMAIEETKYKPLLLEYICNKLRPKLDNGETGMLSLE